MRVHYVTLNQLVPGGVQSLKQVYCPAMGMVRHFAGCIEEVDTPVHDIGGLGAGRTSHVLCPLFVEIEMGLMMSLVMGLVMGLAMILHLGLPECF